MEPTSSNMNQVGQNSNSDYVIMKGNETTEDSIAELPVNSKFRFLRKNSVMLKSQVSKDSNDSTGWT